MAFCVKYAIISRITLIDINIASLIIMGVSMASISVLLSVCIVDYLQIKRIVKGIE